MLNTYKPIPDKPIKERPTVEPSKEIQGNLVDREKKITTKSADSFEYSNDPIEQTNRVDSDNDVPMMYK